MQIVPILLDCFSVLIKDIGNKEIIYNVLLVMSGILLEKNGKRGVKLILSFSLSFSSNVFSTQHELKAYDFIITIGKMLIFLVEVGAAYCKKTLSVIVLLSLIAHILIKVLECKCALPEEKSLPGLQLPFITLNASKPFLGDIIYFWSN